MAGLSAAGIVAIAGTVISTGATVVGGMQQAKAAEAQGEYNQKVYEMEAEQEREAAEFEAEQHKKDVRRLLSAQRARFAASGVDISAGGSVEEVQKQSAMEGELDRQAILYNGAVRATSAENRAKLSKWQGKTQSSSAMTGGISGGASTALTGATRVMQLSSGGK